MDLLDSLKRAFGGSSGKPSSAAPAQAHAELAEIRVPEVTVPALMAELSSGGAPLILDCRDSYERKQGYLPGSTHIAMREIPYRLGELDRSADLVVYCAHGNRSYSVARYLIQNGFKARSLRGGIVEWQTRGGKIERG